MVTFQNCHEVHYTIKNDSLRCRKKTPWKLPAEGGYLPYGSSQYFNVTEIGARQKGLLLASFLEIKLQMEEDRL